MVNISAVIQKQLQSFSISEQCINNCFQLVMIQFLMSIILTIEYNLIHNSILHNNHDFHRGHFIDHTKHH